MSKCVLGKLFQPCLLLASKNRSLLLHYRGGSDHTFKYKTRLESFAKYKNFSLLGVFVTGGVRIPGKIFQSSLLIASKT